MSYYDLKATFRPIEAWPGERTLNRRPSPFHTVKEKASSTPGYTYKTRERGANWSDTLKLLQRELGELRAKNVVIEIDMPEHMIRQDGYPRSDARARSPGVILSFESKYGPVRYPCDAFTKWEDNVRAIALALEALRKVDRYGVTKRGEQYTGWKKLGTGIQPVMTVDVAARFVAAAAGVPPEKMNESVRLLKTSQDFLRDWYREAAKILHPDRGGETERFQQLQEAKRVLDAHHGGSK